MNEDLTIEPRFTCTMTSEEFSLDLLQQVCKQVYLTTEHVDVEYIILSRDDHEQMNAYFAFPKVTIQAEPVAEKRSSPQVITKMLNQTTGSFMDIYKSSVLPQGTIIFGTYHDNSAAPTLSKEDILSGKF